MIMIPLFVIKYLMIGFVWLLIVDLFMEMTMDNKQRIRYFLLWPLTLGAFLLGVILALLNDQNQDNYE